MKRPLSATVRREGDWYIAQCLDVDVASQGETEEEALANLKEVLELHFEPPLATRPAEIRTIEVEVGVQQAELDRRLETLDQDRRQGITWAELKAELEQRCP